jgi:hypothetical protein
MTTTKFLCLCYYDEAKVKAWTPAEQAAVRDACAPHDQALRATGHLVLNSSLAEPDTARVIRPTASGPVTTKGAFAPMPEPIGALFIVDAPDIEEAVRIASHHPSANLGQFFGGGIELRAFDYFELDKA